MTRKDITVEKCVELFDNGMNIKQIASELACSPTLVSYRLKSAGKKTSDKEPRLYCKAAIWCDYASGDTMQEIKDRYSIKSFMTIERYIDEYSKVLHNKLKKPSKMSCTTISTSDEIDETIKKLNAEGLSDSEIARRIGLSQKSVWRRRRNLGFAPNSQNAECNRNLVGNEYVLADGNTVVVVSHGNRNENATIRCCTCNLEFTAILDSVKRGHLKRCPHCHEKKFDDEWWAAEKYQPTLRLTYWSPYVRKITDLDEVINCAECGKEFRLGDRYNGKGKPPSCCSDDCTHKHNSRNARHKRRLRIVENGYEQIKLNELRKRDNDTCYLCGEKVDDTDFQHNDNGVFIAGPNYPSIDHVKPLSKGGSHTWDNVRLAHRLCNSHKSATPIEEFMEVTA